MDVMNNLNIWDTTKFQRDQYLIGKCICCKRAFNLFQMKDKLICLECYKLNKKFKERRKKLRETLTFKKLLTEIY